jgi:peptidoglycan-associated lipoprotein
VETRRAGGFDVREWKGFMMLKMSVRRSMLGGVALLTAVAVSGCAKQQPPVARTPPPPPPTSAAGARPPAPPEPITEPTVVPPEPVLDEVGLDAKSLDDLNRESPLQPVFYGYDSAELTGDAQAQLTSNAEILKQHPSWMITIEGHCDERGTAEYNLALGERRALAASAYLVSLGIPATRLRTVSYGKEFPFDPGKTEEAYAKNRRAHFVITAK